MQNSKCKITIQNSKILSNKKIGNRYYKIIIATPKIAKSAKPGQFIQVKINEGNVSLLRRPFSIHSLHKSNIEILYEVVGRGTEFLSQRKAGGYLDVIGPLGNGFDLNRQTDKPANRQTILVAGGMGVAPLIFLAKKLMKIKNQKSKIKILVLIGAKTKSQILCAREFKQLGGEVKISTDDGSRGFKGKVTDLLKHLLSTINYQLSTVYACGPKPMLKEITMISKGHNIPTQVSLDEHMACGIGACLGCVVETKSGYKRVCKEGPVFKAQEIVW